MSKGDKPKRPVGRPPLTPEEKEKRRLAKNKRQREQARERREAEKLISHMKAEDYVADNGIYDRSPGGRPKGSKNSFAYDSVGRLRELKFDPIAEAVELYRTIDAELNATYENADGKEMFLVKRGSQAHATMLSTMKGITDQLAKYGYRPVPEKKEVETTNKTPTIISLTPSTKKEEPTDESNKEDTPSETGQDT